MEPDQQAGAGGDAGLEELPPIDGHTATYAGRREPVNRPDWCFAAWRFSLSYAADSGRTHRTGAAPWAPVRTGASGRPDSRLRRGAVANRRGTRRGDAARHRRSPDRPRVAGCYARQRVRAARAARRRTGHRAHRSPHPHRCPGGVRRRVALRLGPHRDRARRKSARRRHLEERLLRHSARYLSRSTERLRVHHHAGGDRVRRAGRQRRRGRRHPAAGPDPGDVRLARRLQPQLGRHLDRRHVRRLGRLVRRVPHPVHDAAPWSRPASDVGTEPGALDPPQERGGVQVPSRRVWTATPYALTGMERNYTIDAEARSRRELGGEVKYGVTPSLTLDLTYNTDFAQVEVDEQRINLTRFPLFFPEKRPFFLENAGIFSAGTPQAVDLFFTRRIGIDTLGQPVPILGGGRVSGRVGDLTVGALQIFTDRGGTQRATSYSVIRLQRALATRSRIGVIAVQRMATGNTGDWNRVFGLDGRIGIGDPWTIDWWGAASGVPGPDGDATAYSARLGYETGAWSNVARFIQVGSAFDPQVGFLNRGGGYRYYEAAVM